MENDTDRSDKGGKSRSSHKTTTTDRNTTAGKSESSATAIDQTTSASPVSSHTKIAFLEEEGCELFRKSDSSDASYAEASTQESLFRCPGAGLKLESKDNSIKGVFISSGTRF